MVSKEFYDECVELKKKGELFPFEEITYEDLKQLWQTELCSDKMIGELFDVNPRKISRIRSQNGITLEGQRNEINREWENKKVRFFVDALESTILEELKEKPNEAEEIVKKHCNDLRKSLANN